MASLFDDNGLFRHEDIAFKHTFIAVFDNYILNPRVASELVFLCFRADAEGISSPLNLGIVSDSVTWVDLAHRWARIVVKNLDRERPHFEPRVELERVKQDVRDKLVLLETEIGILRRTI